MIYGVFLILAGAAGFLSNPEKAKTALLSGGLFGSLSILWGVLRLQKAAVVSTVFLALVFTWRAVVTWGKVLNGAPEKVFAAGLISLMLAASLLMLFLFFKERSSVK